MPTQTLLIIIDNLKKGGAEGLLVGILPELNKKYEVILVTLTQQCDFKDGEVICKKKYTLGFKNKLSFISCIIKLKKIINLHHPTIIHAHLIYSSLIARLAGSSKIPLFYSVHGELSKSDFDNSRLLTFLEKITIRKNHSIVAVSKVVLEDYKNIIRKTKNMFILRNYISDGFFENHLQQRDFSRLQKFKIIAVGNLKISKNYEYLLRSLIYLKDYPVSLDIFGDTNHQLLPTLQSFIDDNKLPVKFKGIADNIRDIFPQYDLYIMSSIHEGFGIAAVEAMSSGLPLLLSDLPVLREVTFDNALFFDLNDPLSLSNLIKQITEGKYNLNELSLKGSEIAKQYTKEKYLKGLLKLYSEALE